MQDATDPDSIRRLARSADAAAERARPWQVGHELARLLTANDRSMTEEEVAVVQALERMLNWAGAADHPTFEAWWLDAETSLDEVHETWPAVWASVAAAATHPTVVAHLCDLLWSVGYAERHVHARRASDQYLASAGLIADPYDGARALIRAHQLAGAVRDQERLTSTAKAIGDLIRTQLAARDHSIAIWLLEHLLGRRSRGSPGGEPSELLAQTWAAVSRTDHVERVAKLLLRQSDDERARQEIIDRVVKAFREHAHREEGFGRLIALREALRVAEELGHPSHADILHEIETLDPEHLYSSIKSEHVLSRADVADFVTAVVGTDSLRHALARFSSALAITPDSLQRVRNNTPVGLRHLVTSYQIGEANSVVTTSETGGPDEDSIAFALERDVRQQAGRGALVEAFLFLVPSLHQTLASYEPWTYGDLHQLFDDGPADAVVADAMVRAIQHFHHRRYDEALHVALPRVERLLRQLARRCGVATTKRPTRRVGGIRGLGEILHDLHRGGDPLLPEPFLTASELTLTDPDSLNLRNNFLHGISNEARAAEAALVLQLGLALSLLLREQEQGPATDESRDRG